MIENKKQSIDEIQRLMDEITDLGYRDIAAEIMEWAQKWKLENITDDRFSIEMQRCIDAGMKRREKQGLIIKRSLF